MKVVKHDAGAQQTELELTYGKLRTQAQRSPTGREIRGAHTGGRRRRGGTDFFVEYANGTMNVIASKTGEGLNLAGVCVLLKAGQMTSVRSGDNSGPLPPQQATLDLRWLQQGYGSRSPVGRDRGRGPPWCLGTIGMRRGSRRSWYWVLGDA